MGATAHSLPKYSLYKIGANQSNEIIRRNSRCHGIVEQQILSIKCSNTTVVEVSWLAASDRSKDGSLCRAGALAFKQPSGVDCQHERLIRQAEGAPKSSSPPSMPAFPRTGNRNLPSRSVRLSPIPAPCAFRPTFPWSFPRSNGDHIQLIENNRGEASRRYVVTIPNCSAIGLVIALAPCIARHA